MFRGCAYLFPLIGEPSPWLAVCIEVVSLKNSSSFTHNPEMSVLLGEELYLFHISIKQLAMYLPLLYQILIFTVDDALLLSTIKSYTQL